MVSFDVSREDSRFIHLIVDRALEKGWIKKRDVLDATMDLTACHANGCPLDLARLVEADDFNLAHDFGGIRRHLDRNTGQLTGHFLPRYAKRQ